MYRPIAVSTPLGRLTISEDNACIVGLAWGAVEKGRETPLLRRARTQLVEYFDGQRTDFELPLAPRGTKFQLSVWTLLQQIPYGETRTYGELAGALSNSPRAVGNANGRNPIPIFIPCHRVIGKGGALTGYSSVDGIATKRCLLDLEGKRRLAP